ncbi:MAG: T9SS type A sorting domain-containing protein, partial [Ignavibacteriae bacterium]|nr:T9SS type A sorting domain-containing protein [Ignavibacteriota bacterium]
GILTDKNRNVWLYGIDGIVVSYDSGNNWLHNESEQKNSVLKLCSIKKDILYSLYLGGQDGNGIYYSSNQGNDWKEIYKNNSSILLSISCTEQGLLWAVGKEGRILKYNGEITEVNELSKNYDSFKLYQNYPNPFNSSTNINFILEKKTEVKLDIYNVNGEKIKTIINNYKQPGNYSIIWDGKNNKGEMVSSGIYYYRLIQINNSKTKKMILLQ